MDEFGKKRSRKSKIELRDCEDNMQESSKSQRLSRIHFDIKIEVESCEEDNVNEEVNITDDDLFEAEEQNINELALSLTGKRGLKENTDTAQVTVKNEFDNATVHETNIDDNDITTSVTSLTGPSPSTGKRKRIPNIKKEYDYTVIDDDEEHDINALAKILSRRIAKKDDEKKPKIAKTGNTYDLSKKEELWKQLNVDNEDSSGLESDNDDDSWIKELEKEMDWCMEDEESGKGSDQISNAKDVSSSSGNELVIKVEAAKIEEVDRILDVEMRNHWGRVTRIRLPLTYQQQKLHDTISEWRKYSRVRNYKDPPSMYKCYVCEKAWWHFSEFKEHVNEHIEDDLQIVIETNYQEYFIVAYHVKSVMQYFPIEGNCWRCGRDYLFHTKQTSKKTGKYYGCSSCDEGFGNCRLLREHEEQCMKNIARLMGLNQIKNVLLVPCPICKCKHSDSGALEHLKMHHTVPSNVPALGGYLRKCVTCDEPQESITFHQCAVRIPNYECTFCSRHFPCQPALDIHIQSTRKSSKCKFCDVIVPRQCMEVQHLVTHSKRFQLLYKCITCSERVLFDNEDDIMVHRVEAHKRGGKAWFEMVLVPKDLKERNKKIDEITSLTNIPPFEDKTNTELVGNHSGFDTEIHCDKTDDCIKDDSDDVLIVDDSRNCQVIELIDDDESDNNDPVNDDTNNDMIHDDIERRDQNNDELASISLTVKTEKLSDDEARSNEYMSDEDFTGYEGMLSQVFHIKTENDILEVNIREKSNKIELPPIDDEEMCSNEEEEPTVIYNCSLCDYRGTLFKIKIHMPSHNYGNDSYNCSGCLQVFAKVKEYFLHLVWHGYVAKSCPECMAVFQNYSALAKHVRLRTRAMLLRMQFFSRKKGGEGTHMIIKYQCRKCKKDVEFDDAFTHWESHLEVPSLPSDQLDEAKKMHKKDAQKGGSNSIETENLSLDEGCSSQELGSTSQDGGGTSQGGGSISQGGGSTSRNDGSTYNDDGSRQQDDESSSQDDISVTEVDGSLAQDGGSISQKGGSANKRVIFTGHSKATQFLSPELLKKVIAALLLNRGRKGCLACPRVFERRNDTKRHLIEHLLNDAYLKRSQVKSLRCQICYDSFNRPEEYKLHMRSHGGLPVYQCALCWKTFSDSSNFSKHKKVHNIDINVCHICGKKFQATHSLYRHMVLHETTDPIKCKICLVICHTESEYNRHMRSSHDKRLLRFRCAVCRKRFQTVKELWEHRWEVHQERKYKADCPMCDQAYRKFSDLYSHVKEAHNLDRGTLRQFLKSKMNSSEETSFLNCPVCDYKCPTKDILADHFKKKHSTSKTFGCHLCPVSYSTKRSYMKHMKNIHPDEAYVA